MLSFECSTNISPLTRLCVLSDHQQPSFIYAIASSLTDRLVFNNSSLKILLLLFYIALFYSTLYFISFVRTQKNMKKTMITLSAALFALLTMSCNNNPANNADNHSDRKSVV